MTALASCPSCSRHVRVDELRCPFCAYALIGAFAHRPPPRSVVGRRSRAALLALGAAAAAAGTTLACFEASGVPLYGGPADSVDSGAVDASDDADPRVP